MSWKPVPALVGVAVAATTLVSASAVAASGHARVERSGIPAVKLAAAVTAHGVSAAGSVSAKTVAPGGSVTLSALVTSTTTRVSVVDLEVYDATGACVYQKSWAGQPLQARRSVTMSTSWTAPSVTGSYRMTVGVFTAEWASLLAWNSGAATISVAGSVPTTTTTIAAASTSARTTPPSTSSTTSTTTAATGPTTVVGTTTATTSTGGTGPSHFSTLGPSDSLPTEAQCADRVRALATPAEVKGVNATANLTAGQPISAAAGQSARVTGNFTGTTEQILRWGACKWGLDEDIVKAQAAVESWWRMDTKGDWGTDATRCAPGHGLGADGSAGQCPESWGLLQIRYPYNASAFPYAITSSAFNTDYAYAQFRACYIGEMTWLNTVERTGIYAAGDAWGCLGVWFSGRWHTAAAEDYIAKVKSYDDQKIWTTANFKQP